MQPAWATMVASWSKATEPVAHSLKMHDFAFIAFFFTFFTQRQPTHH